MKLVSLLLSAVILLSSYGAKPECRVYASAYSGKLQIALTFDDGPHEEYTEKILGILKKYNIKATFFVIGINASRNKELVKRTFADGHEIGNHTYTHKYTSTNTSVLSAEIEKTDELIYEITGKYPIIFRPPGGKITQSVREASVNRNKNIILWSVDTRDWAHAPVNKIVENVLNNTKDGSIILFHDYISDASPTPEALEKIIPVLIEKGFEFVTVSELIG